jgi:hypothetical protein
VAHGALASGLPVDPAAFGPIHDQTSLSAVGMSQR